MLSIEEIKKLTAYQVEVFKDAFVTKMEFTNLESKVDKIQTTVDAVYKEIKTNAEERKITASRLKNLENWADKTGPKFGIKLEH